MSGDGEDSAPCDRFAREGLAELQARELERSAALPGELAAHMASCAPCQAERARYLRLTGAIAEVSAGARRRGDHVARALASAAAAAEPDLSVGRAKGPRRWRRPALLAAPLVAMAAVAALVWWLRRDPPTVPEPPRFAFEIVDDGGPVLRGDARLGDRLRLTAPRGSALWIYRNDRELLLVCPRDCRRQGAALLGEVALDRLGRYQLVWISVDQAPAPTGELERDIAAARAAGATHELRELEIL